MLIDAGAIIRESPPTPHPKSQVEGAATAKLSAWLFSTAAVVSHYTSLSRISLIETEENT